MTVDNAASFNDGLAQQSQERRGNVTRFAAELGLNQNICLDGTRKLWLINDAQGTDLPSNQVARILDKQQELGNTVVSNACRIITQSTVEDGTMTGVMYAEEGTS